MTTYDRPFGRYLEDFVPGDVYRHWPGKTITEADDHLFCMITMNHHPLHTNAWFAEHETVQGKNVVVGNLVYSLALGMSVPDVSGSCIANLEVESLLHRSPTFHGDTIYAETRVLEATPSKSKDDRGIVTVETKAFNQRGEEVCYFRRKLMVWKTALPRRAVAPTTTTSGTESLSAARVRRFQRRVLEWGAAHRRDLPWRATRDPWRMLVSEVMLQQTQVDRVVGYYEAFLAVFPTAGDCARARPGDVVRLWSGLGYNRRALNLHRAAVTVADGYGGELPEDERALRALPGVGPYTARAVLSFAFELDVAPVDTNVVAGSGPVRGGTGLTLRRGAAGGRPPAAGRTILGVQPGHVRSGSHGLHGGPAGVRRLSPPAPMPMEASGPDRSRPVAGQPVGAAPVAVRRFGSTRPGASRRCPASGRGLRGDVACGLWVAGRSPAGRKDRRCARRRGLRRVVDGSPAAAPAALSCSCQPGRFCTETFRVVWSTGIVGDVIVTFYGVRGSCPCSGDRYRRYGGNTSCLLIDIEGDEPLIVDLGTGARALGDVLLGRNAGSRRALTGDRPLDPSPLRPHPRSAVLRPPAGPGSAAHDPWSGSGARNPQGRAPRGGATARLPDPHG